LEDFLPFAHRDAVQTFYRLLREINGSGSHLETCDCAFRPPQPHKDPNSRHALSAFGRVDVLYRALALNCSSLHTDWLCQRLMTVLSQIDPTFTEAQGVVAFTLIKALHTALSQGTWTLDGEFEWADDDPGQGNHLMLSFWAYGDTEDEVYENLGRVFQNIRLSCNALSEEIDASVHGGENGS
jgi:hypothetical protein